MLIAKLLGHRLATLPTVLKSARDAVELLRPYPSEEMRTYRVGAAVNSVKNDGPECVEAVA